MRCHEVDELPRCDHLGLLPEGGKMSSIPGHQIVGAGAIDAFQKFVIVGVLRRPKLPRWADRVRPGADKLEEL
jgi:hypothetical protein